MKALILSLFGLLMSAQVSVAHEVVAPLTENKEVVENKETEQSVKKEASEKKDKKDKKEEAAS